MSTCGRTCGPEIKDAPPLLRRLLADCDIVKLQPEELLPFGTEDVEEGAAKVRRAGATVVAVTSARAAACRQPSRRHPLRRRVVALSIPPAPATPFQLGCRPLAGRSGRPRLRRSASSDDLRKTTRRPPRPRRSRPLSAMPAIWAPLACCALGATTGLPAADASLPARGPAPRQATGQVMLSSPQRALAATPDAPPHRCASLASIPAPSTAATGVIEVNGRGASSVRRLHRVRRPELNPRHSLSHRLVALAADLREVIREFTPHEVSLRPCITASTPSPRCVWATPARRHHAGGRRSRPAPWLNIPRHRQKAHRRRQRPRPEGRSPAALASLRPQAAPPLDASDALALASATPTPANPLFTN